MADNATHLPPEIIELILSRVSLKSLLRFKTVSKSWNTMISDPAFVKIHHQRAKDSNSDNLFLLRNSPVFPEGFSLVRLDDRKLDNVRVLKAPYGWEHVLCFCKGLLLVQNVVPRAMALWNPSTGAEKLLCLPYDCFASNLYGLCHDPITGDFKVVLMQCDFYAVYSFKNNSWNKIKYECINFGQLCTMRGVCVDGASYWVLHNYRVGTYSITYFDPRDDSFKCLENPKNVRYWQKIFLVDSRGSLCLYCSGRDEKTVRIWIKEKGIDNSSWKTLMNVDMPIMSFKLLCFIGNKIVIRKYAGDTLVVYNPYEKRFEQFDEDIKVYWRGLIPYVDSPFFPTRNLGPIRGKPRRL